VIGVAQGLFPVVRGDRERMPANQRLSPHSLEKG
jgi:hypothetical protein